MPEPGRRQARSALRRQQIIQAALACLTEHGFSQTTMESIQRRSGASNGTIYHLFKSKEQLAAAVYLEGIADYQSYLVAELERCREARDGVFSVPRSHLRWVHEHFEWARFLFQARYAQFMATSETSMEKQNSAFAGSIARWFVRHVEKGSLKRLPPDLYISFLLGPCQEYTRLWVSGWARTPLGTASEVFGEVAWQALRTKGQDSQG
jgi:AcrR family transcriptional regulator